MPGAPTARCTAGASVCGACNTVPELRWGTRALLRRPAAYAPNNPSTGTRLCSTSEHGLHPPAPQAYDVGLVDELGGLDRAVDVARQLARLPADAPAVDHPPRRVPLLLQLLKRSGMVPQNGEGGAPGAAAGAGQLGGLVALAGAVLGGAAGAAGGGTGAGVEALAGLALAAGAGGREVGQVLRQLGVVASQLDGEPKLLSAEAALLAGQV